VPTASASAIEGKSSALEQIQHEPRGAELQEKRRGEDVGIAVDQMQTPVFPRVGERFVAGVDDGTVVLHPLEEIVLDEIGALADLKFDRAFATVLRARSATLPLPVKSTRNVRNASRLKRFRFVSGAERSREKFS